jgi:hypothetical protein
MPAAKHYDKLELGEVTFAGFSKEPPPFDTGGKVRGVRRAGQIYEQRAQNYFCEVYDACYLPSPWLQFRTKTASHLQYCQPDGLLFLPDKFAIVVIEFKLRHTANAYWQVHNLYVPVLEKIFAGRKWHFRKLEVTQWYDCNEYFPCDVTLVQDPLLVPKSKMGVHIWKP